MLITVGIYRPQWFRGKGSTNSFLRLPDDLVAELKLREPVQQCCLGFATLRVGFTVKQITEKSTPGQLANEVPGLAYMGSNTPICGEMMLVNDDSFIGEDAREIRLTKLAEEAGYRFVFTDRKWLAYLINKVDPYLHRIASWVGCQTYGCAYRQSA